MSPDGTAILQNLHIVAAERAERAADAAFDARVRAVKSYQVRRFEQTYADLLAHPRYSRAARFFLDDLYGTSDFTDRDDQFARIVPGLVRVFPAEIVGTVRALSELHALSETLDSAMGRALATAGGGAAVALEPGAYAAAWRMVGRPADRERQIDLTLAVGRALDRYTRNPVLRHSLRLMRSPARAAGLAALQTFLETGFDTFRDMKGAEFFLDTVAARERDFVRGLFGAAPRAPAASPSPSGTPGAAG